MTNGTALVADGGVINANMTAGFDPTTVVVTGTKIGAGDSYSVTITGGGAGTFTINIKISSTGGTDTFAQTVYWVAIR